MFRKCLYQSEYSFQALNQVTTILQRKKDDNMF